MKLVVFTSQNKFHSEIPIIEQMFELGLDTLHLRKPKFSTKDIEEYLRLLPSKYHTKVILHTHHKLAKKFKLKGIHIGRSHRKKKYKSARKFFFLKLRHPTWKITRSCHKVASLLEKPHRYSYVFLAPMYDSISKNSHSGSFSKRSIKNTIQENNLKVIALGGVDEFKFKELKELGFSGAALLGSLWSNNENPIIVFKRAQKAIEALNY